MNMSADLIYNMLEAWNLTQCNLLCTRLICEQIRNAGMLSIENSVNIYAVV
jgi:hypothetical protein